MATDNAPPMDEKAKRTRELLASFYSTEASTAGRAVPVSPARVATLDSINSPSFDPDIYMNLLVMLDLHSLLSLSSSILSLSLSRSFSFALSSSKSLSIRLFLHIF